MGGSFPTVHQLLQEALVSAGGVVEAPKSQQGPPLLPVSLWVDRGGGDGETQEHFLYKVEANGWDPKAAASRMAWTVGLKPEQEQGIEEAFARQTGSFGRGVAAVNAKNEKNLILKRRVTIEVCVRKRGVVLRDRPTFDLGATAVSMSATSAIVQQYASTVCRDLGLGIEWHNLLVVHVSTLLKEESQGQKAHEHASRSLPPVPVSGQGPAPGNLPCLVLETPELALIAGAWEQKYKEPMSQLKEANMQRPTT